MDLTSDDVRDVLKLLDGLPYDELRLETGRFTLTLRRSPEGGWTQDGQVRSSPNVVEPPTVESPDAVDPAPAVAGSPSAPTPTTHPPPTSRVGSTVAGLSRPRNQLSTGSTGQPDGQEGDAQADERPGRDGMEDVRAPLLGTFYRAPKPGAPPFVEVGSFVEEDTVIGLVETMKLFTSVYARVRGTVAEICLADAAFAHEGAVLARVAPERP